MIFKLQDVYVKDLVKDGTPLPEVKQWYCLKSSCGLKYIWYYWCLNKLNHQAFNCGGQVE